MIGLMARLRVKDGHEAAFEAAFQALAERVHNDEPGAVLYQLTRSRTAGHYVVMELYRDQAAVDAHTRTPHFTSMWGAVGEHLEPGQPGDFEFVDSVG